MSNNSTPITVEIMAKASDEPCNVDVFILHDTLLNLPAEKYLTLYKIMSTELAKVYPPYKIIFKNFA